MTFMEGEPYYKDRITKTRKLYSKITRKLESSKEVNKDSKKSHEETVWQKKKEFTRIKGWQ